MPKVGALVVANRSYICHLAYAQIRPAADAPSHQSPYYHIKTNDKERAQVPYQAPTTIAIICRDRVVGQALELLLRGADYDARFLGEPAMEKLGELLDGVQIVLLGPALNAERRERFVNGLRAEPRTVNIPVLELIPTREGGGNGHTCHVMWPCKTEELARHIAEALAEHGSSRGPYERGATQQRAV